MSNLPAADATEPSIADPPAYKPAAAEIGTKEFAGHVVAKIDSMMGDLSLRDQEILNDLRNHIFRELGRRFPEFDLEKEALRHG